jgi:hypothetical protein
MLTFRRPLATCLVAALICGVTAVAGQRPTVDLSATLARVGQRVEEYYARAQSLVCLETIRFQPLTTSMMSDGPARRLDYELRIDWQPSTTAGQLPKATALRTLLKSDGKTPEERKDRECLEPVAPEPLEMLLQGRRDEYVFAFVGTGRTNNRAAVMLDYKPLTRDPATVQWRGDCLTVTPGGRAKGRIWIDSRSDDVLRLDEQMTGLFDFDVPRTQSRRWGVDRMTLERVDSSISYRNVTFTDPEEILLLPSRIEATLVFRSPGSRSRVTQTFTNYRRFVTGARIVEN